MAGTFYYFAYGANMLKKQILIHNPYLKLAGIGRLDGYVVGFRKYSPKWNGATVTLIKTNIESDCVWGCIWEIPMQGIFALDNEMSSCYSKEYPLQLNIVKPDGTRVECRSYALFEAHEDTSYAPEDLLPSATYWDVVIRGAKECGLPKDYIEKLRQTPHNGKEATKEFLAKLKNVTKVYWPMPRHFFAYGSNMMDERMKLHSQTAQFISIGRLDNYRLQFGVYSCFWAGPTVTVVPTANAHVWGAIYKLTKAELLSLDEWKKQEWAKSITRNLHVLTPHMGEIECLVFMLESNPNPRGDNDPIPVEQWPSRTLKQSLVLGAMERHLPAYYIKQLKAIKDNGAIAQLPLDDKLDRFVNYPPCTCTVIGRYSRKPLKLDKKDFAINKNKVPE